MRETQCRNQNRGAAAALLIACALALSACATPDTETGWPEVTYHDVTVHSGDTLSGIAERNNVPESTLIALNGISNPNVIHAGQVLRVPGVAGDRPASGDAPVYAHSAPPQSTSHTIETHVLPPPRSADRDDGAIAFAWPVEGRIISPFGASATGQRNDGINISATLGEPIRAAAAGIVTYAGDELKGYGNLILIRHDDGYVTAYAHAESITVSRGERVAMGQVIGYAGTTGDVRTPQLHFEIRKGTEPVDPKPLLMASSS
ncbi:MAG TPA: M23 family metallopeptidase [Rhizomicrobium sp.]|nr:M23 family metallopeptidase [Rhizomicrobium sp.]